MTRICMACGTQGARLTTADHRAICKHADVVDMEEFTDRLEEDGVDFDPDWCVRPGKTLELWREQEHLTDRQAAQRCLMGVDLYRRVESGEKEINDAVALALAIGTGSTKEFWMERERQYRADKAAGKTDLSDR